MNDRVLALLRCPVCHSALRRAPADRGTEASVLACSGCARAYPIVEGVPRLVTTPAAAGPIARSFGRQWRLRARQSFERDTLYGLGPEEELQAFFAGLGIRPEDVSGKMVLDAGCGDGFLLRLLSAYAAEIVGIDISSSIEIPHRRCQDLPNVTVLQADLFAIPFSSAAFDYVWCEGVLVHTQDPKKGFATLTDLVKPGGRLYVWVYPRTALSVYQRLRDLLPAASRLPGPLLVALCYALAAPLLAAQRLARPRRRWESLQTIAFGLFDNLAPRIQTRHTVPEVRGWFEECGFSDLRQTGMIGMSGTGWARDPSARPASGG